MWCPNTNYTTRVFFFNNTIHKTAIVAVLYIYSLGVISFFIGLLIFISSTNENIGIGGFVTMIAGGIISGLFWVSSYNIFKTCTHDNLCLYTQLLTCMEQPL